MLRERWPFEKYRRGVRREVFYKRSEVEDLLQYSHYAMIHLADCQHCNNGRGRKNVQDVANTLNRWLGPFQTYQQAFDIGEQTGKEIRKCRLYSPHR